MGMHVVIIGNPVDGLKIYGPFKTADAAVAWAEDVTDTWWIAPLEEPINE